MKYHCLEYPDLIHHGLFLAVASLPTGILSPLNGIRLIAHTLRIHSHTCSIVSVLDEADCVSELRHLLY